MANLYLTHKCNRGCSFCFARKVLKDGAGDVNEILTINEIEQLLIHFSGQLPELGLLGGEPFLYPHLGDALELLWQHNIIPKIFTSATNPLPEALKQIDTTKKIVHFVVNIGTQDSYSDEQYKNLLCFFEKFHCQSSLSYTIFDLDADTAFLFDIIENFKLTMRNIRVGVALPIYKGGNQYIKKEDYRKLGKYFVNFAEKAATKRVILGMDCGFVACMFDKKEIGTLQRCGIQVAFCCDAAIDIGPGLNVWNCFPLFQLHKENVLESTNMKDLLKKFHHHMRDRFGGKTGIFEECKDCKHLRRRTCRGGCKSFNSI